MGVPIPLGGMNHGPPSRCDACGSPYGIVYSRFGKHCWCIPCFRLGAQDRGALRLYIPRYEAEGPLWDAIEAQSRGEDPDLSETGNAPSVSKVTRAALPPRYRIPAGTPCQVQRVGQAGWREHTTTRESEFAGTAGEEGGRLVFGRDGWRLRVERGRVRVE